MLRDLGNMIYKERLKEMGLRREDWLVRVFYLLNLVSVYISEWWPIKKMVINYFMWPQGTGEGQVILNCMKGNLGCLLGRTFPPKKTLKYWMSLP